MSYLQKNIKPLKKAFGFVLFGFLIIIYLIAGFFTQKMLVGNRPFEVKLHEDFGIYASAISDAMNYRDYYRQGSGIGPFLYPPPSLFVLEPFYRISPFLFRVIFFTIFNIFLTCAMVYGIAQHYNLTVKKIWYWYPLALGFAPLLEMLYVGQINIITQFGIYLLFICENAYPVTASAGLTLAIVTKLSPLVFIGYLIINRKYKIIFITTLLVGILFILAGIRYGIEPALRYPEYVQSFVHWITLDSNSQTLASKLTTDKASAETIQSLLAIYLLVIFALSGASAFINKKKEPLFITVNLGMMLSANIMWYHHYIFFLVPLFVWMGWSQLKPSVVAWCLCGLLLIQIDRFFLTSGLLIHIFGHLSILILLAGQFAQVYNNYKAKKFPS